MLKDSKIAIVYDWIDKWGGVERVLLTLHEMFPRADFYTSYFDPASALWAKNLSIKTSFIQSLPDFIKKSRILSFPFYPYAFESLNFDRYDLVISVTSSFAKAIITKPHTRHICYLLTPTRYLWSQQNLYFKNPLIKFALSPYLSELRKWDFIAAQRPDTIVSISKTVAERCKKYYKRESQVIYPPFDFDYWKKIKSRSDQVRDESLGRYFLVVSRLEPYKRIDLAVNVFNQLSDRLIIVGEGSELKKLKAMAKNNITFLSKLTDDKLAMRYRNAEALIIPQEEDFGYVALEAQFFGCPVIAFKRGGATETIIDNKTGIYFNRQDEQSLKEALERFHTISYNLKKSAKLYGPSNITKFAKDKFIDQFNKQLVISRERSD
ncbi:glycosyltransferase [Candidatus Roizmanbacteria bacterium]|nr:glycosyltransferase [Candidatus Roizmanbacteria bacterium]